MTLSLTQKVSPEITFVCCIEAGAIESQTVRMIESLRRWGGQLANAPLLAINLRFGSSLSRKTLQTLERLDVKYFPFHAKSQYPWFKYLNKPNALIAAEKYSTSEYIGWLDSNLLFLDEPDQFILDNTEDFVACASDKNIGTTGPEDPFESYWQEICQVVGLDIKALPWVTTQMEGQRIRLYWNSGVFVYRRKTGFAHNYLRTSIQLLDTHLANQDSGISFTDQVALGLTMVKMGLSWRALPYSHNYQMSPLIHDKWYNQKQLKEARVVRYQDCMWPSFWPEFIKCLGDTHPKVADWLTSVGSKKNKAPLYWRAISKLVS